VDRNKIKRAAREAFRKSHFNGLDIVLILKNEKHYDSEKCFLLVNDVFNNLIKK
jgi:ribonuclease P protein component